MDKQANPGTEKVKAENRRKATIVPDSFHTRYVIIATVFVGLLAIIGFADFFGTFRQAVLTRQTPDQMYAIIDGQMMLFWTRIGLYSLSVAFFLFVLLHRVAGPVYRIRRSTAIVASGDLTHRALLRKWDQLKELEADFNVMTASLQDKLNDAISTVGKAQKTIESLEGSKDVTGEAKVKLAESAVMLSQAFKSFKS